MKAVARSLKSELRVYQGVARDPRTPLLAKALLGLAVGYTLMPFDLIPDFIPVIGHLDDLVIVPLLIVAVWRLIPDEVLQDHRSRANQGDGPAK